MSLVWNKIEQLAEHIDSKFQNSGKLTATHSEYSWHNKIYTSPDYRRAHIEIVDFRQSHKIYILHCTIFPHINNPAPIWGFDAVCGASKITGAFHDFSWAGSDEVMMPWFAEHTKNLEWRINRELPPWAKAIFSPSMVAAGFLKEEAELDSLCSMAKETLDYYLANVGATNNQDINVTEHQNRYCRYQKQNPHVINSMVAMGIDSAVMGKFVDEVLFPELA